MPGDLFRSRTGRKGANELCQRNARTAFITRSCKDWIFAILSNITLITELLFHIRIFSSKNIHAKGIRKGELTMTNREVYERDYEELEQYREIGTVEYFKKLKLADNGTIWGFIDEYVAYKNIGTVEECREAVKKQEAKEYIMNSFRDWDDYKCPSCGQTRLTIYKRGPMNFGKVTEYCDRCGQKLKANKGIEIWTL